MATIFENEEFAVYQLEGSNKDSLNLAESDEVTHSQPIKILIDDEVRPQFAETFRLLAQSIQHLAKEENLKTILVMGAYRGDGRSTVVANLGISLALDGRRVILLDADNRNPGLREMVDEERKPTHHWFHSNLNYSGWSLDWAPDQEILLSVPEQDEQLESEAISQLLSSLRETFDFILIDSPACRDHADAFRLAPLVDAVLYVVRRRQQDVGMQRRIKSQLELLGANFLGVIYNES
jgi:Mrp family chromosome partitioning ATPase